MQKFIRHWHILEVMDENIRKIRNSEIFKSMRGIHGTDHAERVLLFALKLADVVEDFVDKKSLTVGALLHDCGRINDWEGWEHAVRSAKFAGEFIEDAGIDCNKELVKKIIIEHCPKEKNFYRDLTESKILADADKLDRFRFGILNTKFLELKESFELIEFAKKINNLDF